MKKEKTTIDKRIGNAIIALLDVEKIAEISQMYGYGEYTAYRILSGRQYLKDDHDEMILHLKDVAIQRGNEHLKILE